MKIYLVRHAQSLWQLEPSDNLDTPLTPTGHEQAKRLGKWLAGNPALDVQLRVRVNALWSSPLVRAQETGVYISKALGLPLQTEECLSEAHFHVSSHLPRRHKPFLAAPPYEPSELYATFKCQAQNALCHMVERAEATGGPVLAVTHGALIETVLRLITDNDAISFSIYNSTINLIEWNRGRWHLIFLNCWDHLPSSLRTS